MKRRIYISNASRSRFGTLVVNLIYQIGLIRYRWRRPLLSAQEKKDSKPLLEPGDLILVGQSRYLSSWFIRGPFTHSLIYVGDGRCIEARGAGVYLTSYDGLFKTYDRLAILRVAGLTSKQAKGIVDFALEQYAAPYDFWFNHTNDDAWFCTELVCAALLEQQVVLEVCLGNRRSRPTPGGLYLSGTEVVYSSDCLVEKNGVLKQCR